MRSILTIAVVALSLGGCAYESRQPPVSTSNGGTPASQMPQPANSLPLGSAVSAPIDRSVVNTIRVRP